MEGAGLPGIWQQCAYLSTNRKASTRPSEPRVSRHTVPGHISNETDIAEFANLSMKLKLQLEYSELAVIARQHGEANQALKSAGLPPLPFQLKELSVRRGLSAYVIDNKNIGTPVPGSVRPLQSSIGNLGDMCVYHIETGEQNLTSMLDIQLQALRAIENRAQEQGLEMKGAVWYGVFQSISDQQLHWRKSVERECPSCAFSRSGACKHPDCNKHLAIKHNPN
ncbi:hypothetical protein K505DRAFT_154660 [Melanomma pulvis-pyrius CBS 109.77]|uniref:Uncharacterized protein n=1 Tax=Melanomma pulvis-pyrius CBS 109.77 TaxID=1314802 RepID=A0A6A6WPN9_9PLEO|nr:hypothetical protein K505DRAFT_154660 [Melanomma pulvis-pyrius CBS 109.77]